MLGPKCKNTDNGATDVNGDGCSEYIGSGECGLYNDGDFDSTQMCCVCGGGLPGNTYPSKHPSCVYFAIKYIVEKCNCII